MGENKLIAITYIVTLPVVLSLRRKFELLHVRHNQFLFIYLFIYSFVCLFIDQVTYNLRLIQGKQNSVTSLEHSLDALKVSEELPQI